jgi:hypothetical protein
MIVLASVYSSYCIAYHGYFERAATVAGESSSAELLSRYTLAEQGNQSLINLWRSEGVRS